MKLDTSSYYPKPLLDDEEDGDRVPDGNGFAPIETYDNGSSSGEEKEGSVNEKEEKEGSVKEKEEKEGSPIVEEPEVPPTEGERFVDNVSTLLSWILVPLLMPVYGALLAFNLSVLNYMSASSKLSFTIIIAGINVAVPALLVILLKRIGLVDDLGLNGRKERLIPYIITMVAMGVTAFLMWDKRAPMWLVMFFAGGGVAAIINMLINFRWKISAHSAGIAGIVALLIRIIHQPSSMPSTFVWLLIWIGLSGLLGGARIWLGRHTVMQVLSGLAVGFLSVFFMMAIG